MFINMLTESVAEDNSFHICIEIQQTWLLKSHFWQRVVAVLSSFHSTNTDYTEALNSTSLMFSAGCNYWSEFSKHQIAIYNKTCVEVVLSNVPKACS